MTQPEGERCGSNARAAALVWCAFVARMIESQRPTRRLGGSAVRETVNSLIGPAMRRPFALIASTWSVAASTRVMSWPARARNAPSVPPIAPAPQTRNLTRPRRRRAARASPRPRLARARGLPRRSAGSARRECHAGYTRPGKVLHPRAVRGIGIDRLHFRPGLGRVPPIMEEDLAALVVRGPFGGKLLHGAVAAVAVADHDALEAAVCHAVENVAHQREVRLDAQGDRAGEFAEVRRHAVGHDGKHGNAQRP